MAQPRATDNGRPKSSGPDPGARARSPLGDRSQRAVAGACCAVSQLSKPMWSSSSSHPTMQWCSGCGGTGTRWTSAIRRTVLKRASRRISSSPRRSRCSPERGRCTSPDHTRTGPGWVTPWGRDEPTPSRHVASSMARWWGRGEVAHHASARPDMVSRRRVDVDGPRRTPALGGRATDRPHPYVPCRHWLCWRSTVSGSHRRGQPRISGGRSRAATAILQR